jgi:hypothetical protein
LHEQLPKYKENFCCKCIAIGLKFIKSADNMVIFCTRYGVIEFYNYKIKIRLNNTVIVKCYYNINYYECEQMFFIMWTVECS